MQDDLASLKELFTQEWKIVVEKNLKEQNDVKLASIHLPPPTSETMNRAAGTHGRAGSARQDLSNGHTDYATKLRSIIARAAWSIARDTGYIHVSL